MNRRIRTQSTSILALSLILVILNIACPFSDFTDSNAYVSCELAEESGEIDEDEKAEEKDFISMKLPQFRMVSIPPCSTIIEDEFQQQHTVSIPTPPPERLSS